MPTTMIRRIGTFLALGLPMCFGSACERHDDGDEVCFEVPDADGDAPAQPEQNEPMESRGLQTQTRQTQGLQTQGMQIQGLQSQGLQMQGLQAQGLMLGDLNGARLELASSSTAVTLRDGRLFANGMGTDALLDAELVVHAPFDRHFRVRVTTLPHSDRVAVVSERGPLCAPGDEGVFVPGHWDHTGAHRIDDDEVTYSCMSGVIAKCVAWGYAPWVEGPEVHQTCTRLARADYCGDGSPWTLEGTSIDVYDDLGVQARASVPGFTFEAAWGEDGAVCVAETRYVVEDSDGRTVRPACISDLPRCTSLADALELGAVLANESMHTPIEACESLP